MALPLYWFRATLRRRRLGYVGLVVLLGITGGLSLFALAGARRTQSSYPRFLKAANASTMAVDTGQYDQETLDTIAAFPQVARSQTYVAPLVAHLANGKPIFREDFEALASLDGRFFDMDRFTATEGRLPDPKRVDEVAVNQSAAHDYGYRVGQKLRLGTYDPADITPEALALDSEPSPVHTMTATIVGIGLFPNEVLQDDTDRSALMLLTPAYSNEVLPYMQYEWQGLELRHGDADVAAVKKTYVSLLDPGSPQFFRVTSTTTYHVQQAVRPLSIALGLFGVIAGLACLLFVGQGLTRQLQSERDERLALRAMGATRGASARAVAFGPLLTVVAGSALAVLVAIAASPLMPLGKVRAVEVARGVDFDGTVLGLGALVLVLVLGTVVWVSAWRAVPSQQSEARVSTSRLSRVVGVAQSAGVSPAGVCGLRLAVEPGRGRTAVPVRSVMTGLTISIVALVAAVTFGSSLTQLVHTPRLYGYAWDTTLFDGAGYGEGHVDVAAKVFGNDENIDAYAGAYFGTDEIDGTSTPLLGMTPGASVHPPILDGRSIETADEAVLGSRTLADLHKSIGDTVELGSGAQARTVRIVGTATLPTIGIIHGQYTSLGVGAIVATELVPGYDTNIEASGYTGPNVWFVKFRPGVDPAPARKKVAREMIPVGSEPGALVQVEAQRPAEIVNATDIGSAPKLLAGALAFAALASLGLALATSVRRRRADLALLKVLGFTRRQLGATVRWQAGSTVLVGLVIGVPLGVITGRVLWRAFAGQLAVVSQPSTPYVAILAVSVLAVVVALIAAAIPAQVARRVKAATVLHSE